MAKRKNDPDAHSRAAAGDEHSVYLDTSLDTHILLTVSDYDTVSDLRKKIVLEHLRCFPTFGPIKIHALKVKRRGYFYHLSESMLVRCAFEGVMIRWFLSVDASSLNGKNSLEPASSNEKGLGAEFVPEETLLCPIDPLKVEQPKVPASTGIDTNGIASATANEKSITFNVGATIGSKERKHTQNQQSRDQGIFTSPAFHDSSNADKRGAEIGSEDTDPSNDKTKKKRKLSANNAISSQDASDRQNNEVIVKDSKNSTHDERPRKRSKKPVAANPNLSSMEDEIGKGKIAIDEVHNTGEKEELSFGDSKVILSEKFDLSHQNDTNGYVNEAKSSAEFLGTNKGTESEKSNNGPRLKKSSKKSVVVKEDALSMERDCRLENKTDEKIEVPNEKNHEIMLSEEVDPKLPIGKAVTTFNYEANNVKEVENTTSEQRKKMKAKKKSVALKPSVSIMVNDNLPTESFLTDHTNKTLKKEESHHEDDPDRQIKEVGSVEHNDTNKVRPVKSDTHITKKRRSNKVVAVKPVTASEKNVNPSSDVPATDLTYKSDERIELPYDDEAMLSERGDAPIKKEAESFLANQVIEAPKENPKNSVNLKKVKRMQTSSIVNLKEQSPIESITTDAVSKDEKVGKKMNVKSHPYLPFVEKEVASQVFNPQSVTFVKEEATDTKENIKSLKSDPKNQLAGRVLKEAGLTDSNGLVMRSPSLANLKKKKNGEIINNSQNKKSLLARSGTIFLDTSSESSKDDKGEESADSSTKSPSDSSSSSSSGYTDASNFRSNSQRNESFGKESGRKNINEPRIPASKKLSLDMIMKSSSRFKKARLTAVESQLTAVESQHEDSESHPTDIVTESQV